MKKLLFISLASISLFASSCKKGQADYPACCAMNIPSSIVAEKNSVAWIGRAEAFRVNADTIAISGRQTEQMLTMKIKFTGKGIYPLRAGQATHYLTVGGDVSVAEYVVDDTAVNTLEITEYNDTRQYIKGKFSLTMKLAYANGNYPATIKFDKGTFLQFLPK